MLRKIIAFAITSGLAKKAWDRYHHKDARRLPLVDITDVVARPVAGERRSPGKLGARRRAEGPSS